MGLILDTTEFIAGERQGLSIWGVLADYPRTESIAVSVITLSELQHGAKRAHNVQTVIRRQQFLEDLRQAIDIVPLTAEIALRVGTIDAELALAGQRIAFPDLIVAATALERGDAVVTANGRHFSRIPLLTLVTPPRLQ